MNIRMRWAIVLMWLSPMMGWVDTAWAADLVLGNYRIPLSSVEHEVPIDSLTGNVVVYTSAAEGVIGDGWCPPGQAGTKPIIQPTVELRKPGGGSAFISRTGPVRLMPNGDVMMTALSPGGLQGDGWCPRELSWITPLRSDRTTTRSGGTIKLTWAAVSATSCHTGGSTFPQGVSSVPGWNSTMPTQATALPLTLPAGGAYSFQLTCVNATGATIAGSVSVSAVTLAECTGPHAPPAGFTRAVAFTNTPDIRLLGNNEWGINASLNLTQWNPPWPGQFTTAGQNVSVIGPFAGIDSGFATISMASSAYLAMSIDTAGFPGAVGSVQWDQSVQFAAASLVTISHCQGDLAPVDNRCRADFGGTGSLLWTLGTQPASACPMIEGVEYFLNMSWKTPDGPNACSSAACWWLVSQQCMANCRAN